MQPCPSSTEVSRFSIPPVLGFSAAIFSVALDPSQRSPGSAETTWRRMWHVHTQPRPHPSKGSCAQRGNRGEDCRIWSSLFALCKAGDTIRLDRHSSLLDALKQSHVCVLKYLPRKSRNPWLLLLGGHPRGRLISRLILHLNFKKWQFAAAQAFNRQWVIKYADRQTTF